MQHIVMRYKYKSSISTYKLSMDKINKIKIQ